MSAPSNEPRPEWRPIPEDETGYVEWLSDLYSYANDLRRCGDSLARIAGAAHVRDWDLVDILYDAALISYGRVFGGGVRRKIDKEMLLEDLPAHLAQEHMRVLGMRDKYVAHSVNGYEQSMAVVSLAPESEGERKLYGVGGITIRPRMLSADAVATFVELVEVVNRACQAEISSVSEILHSELKLAPIDALYAIPKLHVKSNAEADFINTPRKRGQKTGRSRNKR